ncbi:MAG TPA: NAD(P)-dependent oxidoreductase [Mycobacteriales bacterium]|jgi:nucleoside-diphosphate-sugar epimerase|nr:NAD(P)-dependent oxidoreductase [Mycobacteriales bacterium]
MRVFVAGAGGAVGRRLVPMLVERGHEVVGTTRTPAKVETLRRLGAEPVLLDGLDAAAVGEAVARAEPDAVVHEMTALAGLGSLRRFDRVFARTNALRTRGLDHLLAAATAAGARFVAQSYTGWTNAPGTGLATEDDPPDPHPAKAQRETLAAIAHLERATVEAGGLALRYGFLYGPGASEELVAVVRKRAFPLVGEARGVASFVHVDDAAAATAIAVERGAPGVYNVVDDEPAAFAEWLPFLAETIGAPPPRRVPVGLARLLAGEVPVRMSTRGRGASNAKARRELGWTPRYPSWRDGFRGGLAENDPVRA